MKLTTLQSKKAVESLQKSGMNTTQAEAIVELFNEIFSDRSATSNRAEEINNADQTLGHLKQGGLGFDKVFLAFVGVVVNIALLKYIFVG